MMSEKNERSANNFDCDLFRLIDRAQENAKRTSGNDRKRWEAALAALRDARPHVRMMMSKEDRRLTI